MIPIRVSGRGGFALIFALALLLLIILIASAFSLLAYNDLAMAGRETNSIRAYYAAEAGIAKKFIELRSGNLNTLSENFSVGAASGTYSVTVDLIQSGAFPTYRLTSTGSYKGAVRRIVFTARQASYTRYGYFSNDEDRLFWWGSQPIWFITGDILYGPFHTNDRLNIWGDPVFDGPVSSVSPAINYYHGGPPNDNPDFRESLSLGVNAISMPSQAAMIDSLRTQAQAAGGLYLTGDSIVTLLPDGTMNVTNAARDWLDENMPVPSNGALFVNNGYVDVSGALNGRLTIGTSRSIYVTGNILYHDDPRINPSSGDLLGLVAQNNVYVDRDAPYDIEIDAYIVALNTSFGVENYQSGLKGTLSLYGGITQYRRGPVGTFNGSTGERVSGYLKNYDYDTRLEAMAPPYFPPARDAAGLIIYIKTLYSES